MAVSTTQVATASSNGSEYPNINRKEAQMRIFPFEVEKDPLRLVDILTRFDLQNIAEVGTAFHHYHQWSEVIGMNRFGYFERKEKQWFPATQEIRLPRNVGSLLTEINEILPPDWEVGSERLENLDFSQGPIVKGLKQPPTDHELLRGFDGNRIPRVLIPFLDANETEPEKKGDEHLEAIFFLASLLLKTMQTSKDSSELRNAARMTLYIFTPLMKLYELPELSAELEDSAFKILDPEGYSLACKVWEEEIGKRYAPEELESFSSKLRDAIAKGVPGDGNQQDIGEDLIIKFRQKSYLSFYLKWLLNRDYKKDALAALVAVDEKGREWMKDETQREKVSLWIRSYLIIPLNKTKGCKVSIEEDGDTFIKPRKYNENYKIIDTVISGLPGIGQDFEAKFTTLLGQQNYQRDHTWYKMMLRTTHQNQITKGRGIGKDDIVKLSDIARYDLTRVLTIYGSKGIKNSWLSLLPSGYLYDSTPTFRDFLMKTLPNQIALTTRRGARVIYMDPQKDRKNGDGLHPTLSVLKAFAEAVNPQINYAMVHGYEVQNNQRDLVTGETRVVRYRILPRRDGTFRAKRYNPNTNNWELFDSTAFKLDNWSAITVLTKAPRPMPHHNHGKGETSFQEFVTLGQILDLLASETCFDPEVGRLISQRYKPAHYELLNWAEQLHQANRVIGDRDLQASLKEQAMKAYQRVKQEIITSVRIYEEIGRDLDGGSKINKELTPHRKARIRRLIQDLAKISKESAAEEIGAQAVYFKSRSIIGPEIYICRWLLFQSGEGGGRTNLETLILGEGEAFIDQSVIRSWVSLAKQLHCWSEAGIEEASTALMLMRRLTFNYCLLTWHGTMDRPIREHSKPLPKIDKQLRGLKLPPGRPRPILAHNALLDFLNFDTNDVLGVSTLILANQMLIESRIIREGLNPFVRVNSDIKPEIYHLAAILEYELRHRPENLCYLRSVSQQIRFLLEIEKAQFLTLLCFDSQSNIRISHLFHKGSIAALRKSALVPGIMNHVHELEKLRTQIQRAWVIENPYGGGPEVTLHWFEKHKEQLEQLVRLNKKVQDRTFSGWLAQGNEIDHQSNNSGYYKRQRRRKRRMT